MTHKFKFPCPTDTEYPVLASESVIGKNDYISLARLILSPNAGISLRLLDFLCKKLNSADIVEESVPGTIVAVGDRLDYLADNARGERTARLIWPDQGRDHDSVNVLTPLGIALIGLAEGQSISFQSSDGSPCRLTVFKVHSKLPCQQDL